ncbi:MAG: histidine phosphatase family protein [Patescibacteria group bacterium]|nr:histidine phosphatase family protein [Patescibacteria group bacterium]
MLEFRKLAENETRIVVVRHGAHVNNVLTPEAVDLCQKTGAALEGPVVFFDSVFSSPSPRAKATAAAILEGMKDENPPEISEVPELGDLSSTDPELMARVKAVCTELGLSGDAGFAQVMYDPKNTDFYRAIESRGTETADWLRATAKVHIGEIDLVSTHGVARIENALQVLRGEPIHVPERLAANCQMIELIIDAETGELVEENWLDIAV